MTDVKLIALCIYFLLFPVPKIEIAKQQGSRVLFPHWKSTGSFYINIYSTSILNDLVIGRSDGQKSSTDFKQFKHFAPRSSLLVQYRIYLARIDKNTTGTYTITARNEDRETATLNVTITYVKGRSACSTSAM